jgi:hypothetical protein
MAQRYYRWYSWYSSYSANWACWEHGKNAYLFRRTCSMCRLPVVASRRATPNGSHCNSGLNIIYCLTRERTAVENCLQQLQDVGCFVPDLSYFKLRQLKAGEGNVVQTTQRLCTAHQHFYSFLINLFLLHIFNFHKVIISHHHMIV